MYSVNSFSRKFIINELLFAYLTSLLVSIIIIGTLLRLRYTLRGGTCTSSLMCRHCIYMCECKPHIKLKLVKLSSFSRCLSASIQVTLHFVSQFLDTKHTKNCWCVDIFNCSKNLQNMHRHG